jgi:hypothetical protein
MGGILFRRLAVVAAMALVVTALEASSISVSVTKYGVQGSKPNRTLLVAFADEPVAVDVTISVDADGPTLDRKRWWQQFEWVLRDSLARTEQQLPPRSISVVAASRNPMMADSAMQHRGVFRIGKLPPGNYVLRIRGEGLEGSDAFAIRKGDETPFIKARYLELRADRTKSFHEFKAIQLQRAELEPSRADIWLNLATRSLDHGTQKETDAYYTRAIEIMRRNAAKLPTRSRKEANEIRQRVDLTFAHLHALQAALPYYFANRRRLCVVEEPVDGAMHYILKDRRTGDVDRVIRPEV